MYVDVKLILCFISVSAFWTVCYCRTWLLDQRWWLEVEMLTRKFRVFA